MFTGVNMIEPKKWWGNEIKARISLDFQIEGAPDLMETPARAMMDLPSRLSSCGVKNDKTRVLGRLKE
jgi:hypothetical protein